MNLSTTKNSKFEAPFSIKILDDNFDLVTNITYSDLQWSRLYNEAGKFVIDGVKGHVPFSRSTWKYVYTEKRKELGKISQVNWKKDVNRSNLTLSGYFVEAEVDQMVAYAKPSYYYNDSGTHYGVSIVKDSDTPTWISQEGTADEVAQAFFEGFKKISFTNYEVGDIEGDTLVNKTIELDIDFGTIDTAHGEYHRAAHNRNNEPLGHKLYQILKFSGASYEVIFDYANKTKTLNIIHGVNRSQSNYLEGYNPILLSSKNGSIKSASVVVSDTDTKDIVLQYAEEEKTTLILVNALPDAVGRITAESMASPQSDFINDDIPASATQDKKHKLSVLADATDILNDRTDKFNVQFDFVNSSYRYMEDFDLGDIVSVEIPEIDLSLDVQIIGCYEVIKNGVWDLSLEIGTPTIRKRGNM